jgi:hypothetical protein
VSGKSGVTEAPYDRDGNLCHHESDGGWFETVEPTSPGQRDWVAHGPEWRPVAEFMATLAYDGYSRGRSAAYTWWTDTRTGSRYPMFMTDLDEVLSSGLMRGMVFTGRFTVVKRGRNYGIKLLGDH